jgi:hypothetical protein
VKAFTPEAEWVAIEQRIDRELKRDLIRYLAKKSVGREPGHKPPIEDRPIYLREPRPKRTL